MTTNYPINRVHDILRRMEDNSSQSEAMKTCFGILAIMSREDANKVMIVRDGMDTILNAMTIHVDKVDVQEAGCDLLWSLAFNYNTAKDVVGKHGGVSVLVRALKRHSRSADFLKSACGALSNLCQSKPNQQGVASQGGLQPLVGAIHIHQANAKLLPFLFDALASLIVSNEENARSVSAQGGVPLVIAALARHKNVSEVVKSGCHSLAILSDVKGQASKIAFAGGVAVILPILDFHANYADLHRVAAVVLLRMLQESSHVAREITSNEGVRILLKSLEKGGAQHDTVAAVTHILFTITIPTSPNISFVEPQLWHSAMPDLTSVAGGDVNTALTLSGDLRGVTSTGSSRRTRGGGTTDHISTVDTLSLNNSSATSVSHGLKQLMSSTSAQENLSLLVTNNPNNSAAGVLSASSAGPNTSSTTGGVVPLTTLGGLVTAMMQYITRRDVIRAGCRLLCNVINFNGVAAALDKLCVMDLVYHCVSIHPETKDVQESCCVLMKAISKKSVPTFTAPRPNQFRGLFIILNSRTFDDEIVIITFDVLCKYLNANHMHQQPAPSTNPEEEFCTEDGRSWDSEATAICNKVLARLHTVSEAAVNGHSIPEPNLAGRPEVHGRSSLDSLPPRKSLDSHPSSSGSQISVKSACTSSAPVTFPQSNAAPWPKSFAPLLSCLLGFLEGITQSKKLSQDPVLTRHTYDILEGLRDFIPVSKHSDLCRRVDALLPTINPSDYQDSNRQKKMNSEQSICIAASATQALNNSSYSTHGMSLPTPAAPTMPAPSNVQRRHSFGKGLRNGSSSPRPLPSPILDNRGGYARRSAPDLETGLTDDKENGAGSKESIRLVHSSDGLRHDVMSVDNLSLTNSLLPDVASESEHVGRQAARHHGAGSSGAALSDPSAGSSSFVRVETTDIIGDGRTIVKRLLPMHPLKYPRGSGTKLLDLWPVHLERLQAPSVPLLSDMAFDVPDRLQLVYESQSAAGRDVISRCPTPVPYEMPDRQSVGEPFEHSLTFDSEFESGNLLRAIQRGDACYDLFLRADLHTNGHTQWFYFAVANTHPVPLVRLSEQGVQVPPVRVRFNIVNLTKPDSLFNLGMRPVLYSCEDAATKGVGWIRAGSDISYHVNSFNRNGNTAGEGEATYYTLSFTIEFTNAKDTYLIAYTYPYTYTDYKLHINSILNRPNSSDIIRLAKLCSTLGGNDCDLLVITNFNERSTLGSLGISQEQFRDQSGKQDDRRSKDKESGKSSTGNRPPRRSIVLSARVHPGETPASWMMKGIIDFLTSSSPAAELLRQVFVIYIVPMLNPDGVIFGNNRCSLAGVDLNRQWKKPSRTLHPNVFCLKNFISTTKGIRNVSMYVDLHGHSRKYNVFMYGCDGDKKKPKPQVRAFPKFFAAHEYGQKYVSYDDCSFHVKKGRESTARVVVAKELNIPLSYTLEATFCGSNYGALKYSHMNIGHLQEVGSAMCDAILNFYIAEGQIKDVLAVPGLLSSHGTIATLGEGSNHRSKVHRDHGRGNAAELDDVSVLADRDSGIGKSPDIGDEVAAKSDVDSDNDDIGSDNENDAESRVEAETVETDSVQGTAIAPSQASTSEETTFARSLSFSSTVPSSTEDVLGKARQKIPVDRAGDANASQSYELQRPSSQLTSKTVPIRCGDTASAAVTSVFAASYAGGIAEEPMRNTVGESSIVPSTVIRRRPSSQRTTGSKAMMNDSDKQLLVSELDMSTLTAGTALPSKRHSHSQAIAAAEAFRLTTSYQPFQSAASQPQPVSTSSRLQGVLTPAINMPKYPLQQRREDGGGGGSMPSSGGGTGRVLATPALLLIERPSTEASDNMATRSSSGIALPRVNR